MYKLCVAFAAILAVASAKANIVASTLPVASTVYPAGAAPYYPGFESPVIPAPVHSVYSGAGYVAPASPFYPSYPIVKPYSTPILSNPAFPYTYPSSYPYSGLPLWKKK